MKRTRLQRNVGLARGSRLKAKPKRLTPEEKTQRDLTGKRSGGWCELRIDGVCQGPATNKQHRLAEGQGGPTVASNLIDICGMGNVSGCHGFVHQNPNVAVANGWTVKRRQDWRVIPVLLFDGLVLLDDHGHRHDPPQDNT